MGLQLAVFPETTSPVWPATGVAVAGLALAGLRMWPAIALAAFAVELPAFGVQGAVLVAAGNVLEAVVGAWALQRLGGARAFESGKGVGGFLLAMLVAPLPATAMGTLAVWQLAGPTPLGAVAATWYLGDAMGALVFAPPLVLAAKRSPIQRRSPTEWMGFLAGAALVSFIAFYPWQPPEWSPLRLGFLVIAAMAWAAARFGPLVTAWTTIALAAASYAGLAWGTLALAGSPNLVLLQMQALVGLVAVLGLFLAANVFDRNRTIALLKSNEIKLRDALVAVERSQVAKAWFLNKAAHEMRTPLTPMILHGTMLAEADDLTDKHRASSKAIVRSAQRMARLVDRLIDAARTDSYTKVRPADTRVILERARSTWKPEADARNIRIRVEAGESRILADEDAMDRVLEILLSNALNHSSEGSEVRLVATPQGQTVLIEVVDSGPGIAPEDREQLFEPFSEAQTLHGREGTGLGLYIAQSLVQAQGGTLSVGDAPAGACFRIGLPAA